MRYVTVFFFLIYDDLSLAFITLDTEPTDKGLFNPVNHIFSFIEI